jgi:hypothetical protein
MKVSYEQGLATHFGPESCASAQEDGSEALTGVRAGRVLSREIHEPMGSHGPLLGADAVEEGGRPYPSHRYREVRGDLARSETPGMYGNTLRGNREILRSSADEGSADRIGKSKDTRR